VERTPHLNEIERETESGSVPHNEKCGKMEIAISQEV